MTNKEAIKHIQDLICENNTIKPSMVVFDLEKKALYKALEALEKQDRYRWHDLRNNPEDLPDENRLVLCVIYGSDVLYCHEGESLEDAIKRISKRHYTTAGWLETGEWVGVDGYPMVVSPCLWKRIEPFEEDE